MNRSRGAVVFDNGKSIAATRLSRSFAFKDEGRMRAVLRFAGVFALGLIGFSFVGAHGCLLSSPLLLIAIRIVSLVCLPLYVALSKNHVLRVWVAFATPWIAYGLGTFYMDVVHWDNFPSWMLRNEGPQFTAEEWEQFLR